MFRMSGLKSRDAAVAVGRSILIDCSLIIVRLAIMNEASRKNMMSISGMISIRAFLCGNGEPIFMPVSRQSVVKDTGLQQQLRAFYHERVGRAYSRALISRRHSECRGSRVRSPHRQTTP